MSAYKVGDYGLVIMLLLWKKSVSFTLILEASCSVDVPNHQSTCTNILLRLFLPGDMLCTSSTKLSQLAPWTTGPAPWHYHEKLGMLERLARAGGICCNLNLIGNVEQLVVLRA
jgi:hypothetical protein